MSTHPENISQDRLVSLKINGQIYFASPDETILEISKRNGIEIPHLCFKEGMRPDGNCRVCMVEIEGERVLQPSCVRTVTEGMIVNTSTQRTLHSQKLVLELLTSDVSENIYNKDSLRVEIKTVIHYSRVGSAVSYSRYTAKLFRYQNLI